MTSWTARKSMFSHVWLQNALPTHISAAQEAVRAATNHGSTLQQLRALREEWHSHRQMARGIIADCEDAASPKQNFGLPPLDALDSTIARPLAQLVHESWLSRHSVRNRIVAASQALAETDRCVAAIEERLDGRCADLLPMQIDELLTTLKKSVLQCATAMNDLPREGTL